MIINLIESDNGKTINAKVDDKVTVTLPFKPSSGFFWQDSGSTAGILEEVKHFGQDPSTPGAIVLIFFKFRIYRKGDITLSYARPWQETQPPAKWFSVEIQVS